MRGIFLSADGDAIRSVVINYRSCGRSSHYRVPMSHVRVSHVRVGTAARPKSTRALSARRPREFARQCHLELRRHPAARAGRRVKGIEGVVIILNTRQLLGHGAVYAPSTEGIMRHIVYGLFISGFPLFFDISPDVQRMGLWQRFSRLAGKGISAVSFAPAVGGMFFYLREYSAAWSLLQVKGFYKKIRKYF